MAEFPWVEPVRAILLLVVWSVLLVRVPALWRPRQRPAWVMLATLALGSVVIQAPVRHAIADSTHIACLDQLVVSLAALTDFASVWWLAIALSSAGRVVPSWWRRAPALCASTMAVLAVAFFFVTPVPYRFATQAQGWWIGYAIAWTLYCTITTVGAGVLYWRAALSVRKRVVRISVLFLGVGMSAELPYLLLRGIRWFVPHTPPVLTSIEFWCSFARFVLVALGCSLAAIEPLTTSIRYWYRRQRLYPLWHMLRHATPELAVAGVPALSRASDAFTIREQWDHLHQRVVEIRDSILSLYNRRATPELVERASEHAAAVAPQELQQLTTTACVIEVTRREALAQEPKRDSDVDKDLLHSLMTGASTDHPGGDAPLARIRSTHTDIERFSKFHRLLKSREVQAFADSILSRN